MVIDLLGPSLAEQFKYCHRKFSVKTVLMLADQLLERMEYMHGKGGVYDRINKLKTPCGVHTAAHRNWGSVGCGLLFKLKRESLRNVCSADALQILADCCRFVANS